jgi:3-oxoacyl-[acyl-carrier-protein] synthase-3
MSIYSRITGTGSYFPPKIMTNDDIAKFLDTSDEWIVTRTGIKQRHVAENESCSDMAAEAGKKALEMAGIGADQLDAIIVATLSPDTIMPSTGCRVQHKIGAKNCMAFDIAAACSGFLYGVRIADGMIRSGSVKNVLVIGSEHLTACVDWRDRTTCILFGDGAGAAVISADTTPGIRSIFNYADGEYGELLKQENLGSQYLKNMINEPAIDHMIKMKGNDIFKIAVRAMADAAQEAASAAGFSSDQIDWMIPHQANLRIIDAAAKRLGLDKEKVIINLTNYGNTSAATIPTALDQAVRDGRIQRGHNVVSAAFGGGLTWGSMAFTF